MQVIIIIPPTVKPSNKKCGIFNYFYDKIGDLTLGKLYIYIYSPIHRNITKSVI